MCGVLSVLSYSVVGRWLGVCVCGTWLCGERKQVSQLLDHRDYSSVELYNIPVLLRIAFM